MNDKVPVNDAFFDEGHEAITDLTQELDAGLFWNVGMVVYVLFKVAITNLLYNVVVMRTLHHVKDSNNVLRLEQLQYLNLGKQSVL